MRSERAGTSERRRSGGRGLLAALCVSLLTAMAVVVTETAGADDAAAAPVPLKVMTIGDSVTAAQTLQKTAAGPVDDRSDQWPSYRGALYEKLTGAGSDAAIGQKLGTWVELVGSVDGVGTLNQADGVDLTCPSTEPGTSG